VTRRVAYSERAPSELLRSFVVCSWTRDATLAGDAPTSDRILPDGCVDIIWDERSLFVAGPDTRPVLVDPVGQPTRYAGVRFRPGKAPAFLRVPSSELVDQRVPLDAIWDAAVTQRLTDRLASAASMRDAVSEMERALTERLDGEVDRVAAAAISAIATDPAIRVAGIAARVGVTERTLHRRVLAAVGYGPKMLQRVARFRRFLALAPRRRLCRSGPPQPGMRRARGPHPARARAAFRCPIGSRRAHASGCRLRRHGRPGSPLMNIRFVASFSPIVRDVPATRALYRDAIGVAFEGEVGDYLYTEKLDGVKHLGLWPLAEAAQACFGTPEWPADVLIPQASIEFEVDDVPAAAAELEAAGYTLVHGPRTEPWGQTLARLLDPNGLIVGVCVTPGLSAG
jgi:catechol 2,3-dioxygenase-like lactoylglutathione lyase family enzyme